MKKRLKAMLVAIAVLILLCPAAVVIASKITTHTHQILTRDIVVVEKLYTHSHYCEKNGRWDWWPCGVYQEYRRVERYCVDCGQIIESISYTDHSRKLGEPWHELEY